MNYPAIILPGSQQTILQVNLSFWLCTSISLEFNQGWANDSSYMLPPHEKKTEKKTGKICAHCQSLTRADSERIREEIMPPISFFHWQCSQLCERGMVVPEVLQP